MQMLLNNRYQVIRTLGGGGFGETFLAEDIQMPSKRRCVIKLLKPIQNNPQIYQLVQERFQREAAILEDLGGTSDQIPTLYAYFQSEGQFYLVQEWIEGDTLTVAFQQQGQKSESAVREIFVNLLPVLSYVHSKRIIHRDIKPDNIILRDRDRKPVLIDFGAVRESMGTVINSQGNPTSSIVIGTPGYMPSEQAMGRPVYCSDLYSLGMTAIYLLTGKQPHELETDPRTGEIVWRNYALSVSPTLAAVIDKAIAYHPRDRFSTAREMLNALQSGAATIPPTVPYNYQPPAQIPSPPVTPQNTIPISPAASNQQPSYQPANQSNGHKEIFLGSLIAGSLIGASVIIGLTLNKAPQQQVAQQPQTQQTASSTEPTTAPVEPENTAPRVKPRVQKTLKSSPEPSPEPLEPEEDISSVKPQEPSTPVASESPSSQLPTSTPPPVDRLSPEKAVQNYYATINQGEFKAAWNQLSPNLQSNKKLHPNGYLSYIDWWGGKVQSVDVEQVSILEANPETATVNAQVKYLLKNGKESPSNVRLSLLWDAENNRWVIGDAR
ncbi:MAG: protein kinase [Heteroscytonema crispum UTEX LB 1556]